MSHSQSPSQSAPYWGELPPPRIHQHGQPSSLDAAAPRPKRGSVQTAISADPTESTQSPYATPTRSSFGGAYGLAPRPPSLPYGADQYPVEPAEKRQRRWSRQQELDQQTPADSLESSPNTPHTLPPTFRSGTMPSSPGAPAVLNPGPGRRRGPPNQTGMEPEDYSVQNAVPGRHKSQRNGSYDSTATSTSRPRPNSSVDANVGGHGKNITKEEKRARVAAAEERARQRALGAAAEVTGPDHQQRSAAEPQGRQVQHEPIAMHRGPLTQNPPEDGPLPEPRVPAAPPAGNGDSDLPKRNLSFRERTVNRNDLNLPEVDERPPTIPPKIPILRSGSNKLRKQPPGERHPRKTSMSQTTGGDREEPRFVPHRGTSVRIDAQPSPPEYSTAAGPQLGQKMSPYSSGGNVSPPNKKALSQSGPPQRTQSGKLIKASSLRNKAPRQGEAGQHTPPGPGNGVFGREQSPVPKGPIAFVGDLGPPAAIAATRPATTEAQASDDDSKDVDDESVSSEEGHFARLAFANRESFRPGQGLFQKTTYLDEWSKATVGTLSGELLDLDSMMEKSADKSQAWWENPPSKRRGSTSSRPRKAEAFDGEYDETNAPTRFKPPLYLKCGPLLRYSGIRVERGTSRSARAVPAPDREIWRGSILIVTRDDESSYEIAPTLRLFAQPIELLPPPPEIVSDEQGLAPEHVDPIAGHPKLGRRGETLYVRPIDHLEEAKDLSRDETDSGLFEKTRSLPDYPLEDGLTEPHGSFAARRQRAKLDGEKLDRYKDVRGFRLHAERGCTFWRFNIEVELKEREQRIAYRINRGPSTGFWVPARGQSMNIMFHSCNGFSATVNPNDLSGPDPMWRDVLNTHQARPFHVMVGGGDQLYMDAVMRETKIFKEWTDMRNPMHKHNAPFTPQLQDELENYFLERYSMWFSQGLFGMASSQIPMVNIWDDHDIIDGFGSYPHHFMSTPVFSGLGNVAFKYYMLFQHQSVPDETEAVEPSWALGTKPGPYIAEQSRSVYMSLGGDVALLGVDCRTERTHDEVMSDDSWQKLMDRCYDEIVKGRTKHLLVLLGVPIAYPRLVWLENILTSRLFEPVKALAKMGLMGGLLNRFDGGVEVLDDLDDHWTAKHHKKERKIIMEDLQDLAADRSVRVTILSGDVHLAAVGQFYSDPKLSIAKHKDFRYMPNIISSAIVNTPPPDMLADVLNKRNKVHILDNEDGEKKQTWEDMIPLFNNGVDGKPRNNKRLLPHRNWCAIRHYVPGDTPPPSPGIEEWADPIGTPSKGGIMRRLSKKRPAEVPRPPVSGAGGLFRTFSRAERASADDVGPRLPRPQGPTRTLSLTRGDFPSAKPSGSGIGGLLRRLSGRGRKPTVDTGKTADDGGINGQWGYSSDEDDQASIIPPAAAKRLGLRGGGAPGRSHDYDVGSSSDEYYEGDESYFTAQPVHRDARPPRPVEPPVQDFQPKSLHRTPTSMTANQRKQGVSLDVNLEDALLVTLNVEVNAKDPAGITTPYRLLVPRLFYEYSDDPPEEPRPEPSGIKRLLSLKRNKSDPVRKGGGGLEMTGARGPPPAV
ncbi:hypothetical protein MCOR29_008600 [Pyricularia oryzae]|uniref:PhoD-like phosphatase domain-containing protein n=1 Tax=Pyricularia grisea TaxID=148305 RepID=A0ABQ8N7K5_PYRGI|nr:hypothetical protein MCOR26_007882 [Pyricularia oryzae]KAI6292576.1 hypothetical protein MCOR33_009745 [Pyricularia grisea]KAI6310530.1 hypothetical protein MCOR29_008600 [Pyricularia oryzae]KAI6314855.1 hypothetical protein MCOR30_009843 [Pyricularia oryzae]KAI6362686.1 hypothetical protein MCOR31_008140 [Pyricularia oryzae]